MQRREPLMFMLQLAMFGSGLLFLGLLLAYAGMLERHTEGFSSVKVPLAFWASTLAIVLSSMTLYVAKINFKEEKFAAYRTYAGATLFLGICFVVLQIMGGFDLFALNHRGQYRSSRGFVYLISAVHVLHIVFGIAFLIKLFIEALRRTSYLESFVYAVNPPNQRRIAMMIYYWHFVDILWLVLFAFMLTYM